MTQRSSSSAAAAGLRSGKSAEPVGPAVDHRLEPVIDTLRADRGFIEIERLRAGRAVGKNLKIDTCLVHFLDTDIGHVEQAITGRFAAAGLLVHLLVDIDVEIMLLNSNDL